MQHYTYTLCNAADVMGLGKRPTLFAMYTTVMYDVFISHQLELDVMI